MVKLHIMHSHSVCFWIANWKIKDSGSRHSMRFIYINFLISAILVC